MSREIKKVEKDGIVFDEGIVFMHRNDGMLELWEPYHFGDESIEPPFVWDGNSSPNTPVARWLVPRYATPGASAMHDKKCKEGKPRKPADKLYRTIRRIAYGVKGIFDRAGYWGVRIGAFLGIGVPDDKREK